MKLGPHIILPTEAAKHWAANAPIVLWAFRPPTPLAETRRFELASRRVRQGAPLIETISATTFRTIRLQADTLAATAIPAILNAARPGAITICRPVWMLPKDGRSAAVEILSRYRAWGVAPTYTQLWNEFDEWGRDELRERLRQGRIAGDILRANGFPTGDNIASTGTLEEGEWRIAAEEGFGGMDVLFVHEYRGCLSPTTRVLTADLRWVEAGSLKAGDLLLAPEEEPQTRERRALLPSRVISNFARKEEVYDIVLETGERLRCTAEHPWLVRSSAHKSATKTKHKWVTTQQIPQMLADKRRKKRPLTMPRYFPVWAENTSYEAGYLAGVFDGEGSIATKSRHLNLSFSQKENELLFTAQTYLTQLGFETTPLKAKNFKQVYVNGGRAESFKFLGSIRPPRLLEIWRKKIAPWQRQSVLALEEVPIISVERVGLDWICSLETSTHTYFAEGFGSHNSEGMTTWNMLRYRRMHDILNGNHPSVIVAETGRDRVEGGKGGWKADDVSVEQFVGELKTYDAEIQKDAYILGATVFTSGPTPDWEKYSMDGLEQYFIEEEPVPWKDTLPNTYREFTAEGGTPEAFESIIQGWFNDGGNPEESALRYLVGTRRLKATQARLERLSRAGKAAFQELNDAVQPYLPPL